MFPNMGSELHQRQAGKLSTVTGAGQQAQRAVTPYEGNDGVTRQWLLLCVTAMSTSLANPVPLIQHHSAPSSHPAANAAAVRKGDEQAMRPQARLLRLFGQPRNRQVIQDPRCNENGWPELRQICMQAVT